VRWFERQVDLVVDREVLLDLKAVGRVLPICVAQRLI
jgi:hypothetical protein